MTQLAHSQLVEFAHKMLHEVDDVDIWLPLFDEALGANDDVLLTEFCKSIRAARVHHTGRAA